MAHAKKKWLHNSAEKEKIVRKETKVVKTVSV